MTIGKTVYAPDREMWWSWLEMHYKDEEEIWLIFYKKSAGKSNVSYNDAVEEALCFGWVDSKVNKRDEQSYFQYFAQRNPKSNWSRVNKQKVAKLIAEDRMSEADYAMIEEAKRRGTWDALNDVENLVIPPDMQAEFDKNPVALQYYEAFPRSVKRGILEWIFNAKRPATRVKRILQTAEMANRNERANQYRKK